MIDLKPVPDVVRRTQAEASDPRVSAFVSANAGAGKTHVLADRVIRLLLAGISPEQILCITFTKAAAANMAQRVFDKLSHWITLDDASLDAAMRDIGAVAVDAADRARARRLFAAALETPGGLKVQTIHALCARVLQQFPFEANVAAHFSVLDERPQNELLDRATLATFLDAAAAPESQLGRALGNVLIGAGDAQLRNLIRAAVTQRDKITNWIDAAGNVAAAMTELSSALGIEHDDDLTRIDAAIVDGPIIPVREWTEIADICAEGSANDRTQCQRLRDAAAATGPARVEAYLSVLVTGDGDGRRSLITADLAKKHPGLARRLLEERDRVLALLERRRAVITRERTGALLTVATEVIRRYRYEKERRGLLDYDDLIDKALAMLDVVPPSWVHFKLDYGINHVLIDEAQDISPKQWDVICRLVSEFTAGAGARGVTRTIFAVGDEKQSIFSFQGAAPKKFEDMRRIFAKQFRAAELEWRDIRLQHSFRSGSNVLGAVECVFDRQSIYRSITSDAQGMPPHLPLPDAAPGLVEVWPLENADEVRDLDGWEAWDAPFDALPPTSPQVRLARRIAVTISRWIEGGLRAGDILVLVRQRSTLFETIIRALKDRDIAVAGADRLVLTQHIAIEDLMALADAVLLPTDDLALAVALKSPLFGLNDEQLFKLAWQRSGTLRAALCAQAGNDPALAAAAELLGRCASKAQETAFAFYAWLLGPERGRAKMLARLGPEAADALDELLELALEHERREASSLQGFIAWLRAAEIEIKRDLEIARDEVRVMTVHAAKGLEAHTVVLADTTTNPIGPRHPWLLRLPARSASPGRPDCLIWPGPKHTDVPAVAAARAAALTDAEDEYRRLLYVAMTRAAQRLIVCGVKGTRRPPERCWYDLVVRALNGRPEFIEQDAEDGSGKVRRYRRVPEVLGGSPASVEARAVHAAPEWLRRAMPAEPQSRPVVAPSSGRSAESLEARRQALLRGKLVHRLLQSLPDIPPERRSDAARRFLATAGTDLPAAERDDLVAQILSILADTQYKTLFAAGSRAEVPIIGRIETGAGLITVSGQVDRLAVGSQDVVIADYKTDRPAARLVEDVPRGYVQQLALYRAVLAKIYPGRAVRAVLVWTDVPDLMPLPATILDAELAAGPGRMTAP